MLYAAAVLQNMALLPVVFMWTAMNTFQQFLDSYGSAYSALVTSAAEAARRP